MSVKQLQAVWELCRQGFPITADDAARSWNKGAPFEPEEEFHLAKPLESLIEQCNWEIEKAQGKS